MITKKFWRYMDLELKNKMLDEMKKALSGDFFSFVDSYQTEHYDELLSAVDDILHKDEREYKKLYNEANTNEKAKLDTLYKLYEGDYNAIIEAYKEAYNR